MIGLKNNSKDEFILLGVYVFINILMYHFSASVDAPLAAGADVGQYLRPARSLVDYGEFTMNPPGWTPEMGDSRPFTFGTPLYAILLAVPYFLFGQNEIFYAAVVIMQCSLLYFIGWLSRFFLPFFNSSRSILIHSLVIFNPNSLTTAHLMQSETLFTLFVVLSLLYIFRYIKYGSISDLVMVGIFAGLLALTRPAGLYFIYMIPIVLLAIKLLHKITNQRTNISSHNLINFFSFLIPILVAFLVMSPWYARNYVNSHQFFLTSESGIYLKDNYQTLIHRSHGVTEKEAFELSDNMQLEYFEKNGISPDCLTNERDPACGKNVFDAVLSGLLNEPIENHIKGLFYSWGSLYFSGGASNFRNYLGLEGNAIIVDFHREEFKGLESITRLIQRMNADYFVIFILFTGFATGARLIAVVGVFRMLSDPENISYFISIIGVLAIFTAMYLYLGQSRFRVPMEPILMLLTVLAFAPKKSGGKPK